MRISSRWSGRPGVAGTITRGSRVESVQAEILPVRWVPVHSWWQDLRRRPVLGLVQDPGIVQGLTAAVAFELIMVDDFDLSSGALLDPVD